MKYFWVAYEKDKYELPIYVADSIKELSRVLGISYKTVKGIEEGEIDSEKFGIEKVLNEIDRIPKEYKDETGEWTDGEIEWCFYMRELNYTYEQIGNETGRTPQCVRDKLHSINLKKEKK